MAVHRLISIDGTLYFPTGGTDLRTWAYRADAPSILMQVYSAGDCDTCPWPLEGNGVYSLAVRKGILARALYGERECNSTFAYGDTVELPDGTVFAVDEEVAAAEAAERAETGLPPGPRGRAG